MELKDFQKDRKTAKSQITRIFNWIQDNVDSETDIKQFLIRKDLLKDSFNKYSNAQNEIEELDQNDCDNRVDVENKYCLLLSKIEHCIEKLSTSKYVPKASNSSMSNVPFVKLPELSITAFDGQISSFKSYFELFTALIINNPSLSNIQRFFYLKSSLKGEALKLIDSLEVTNDNFIIATEILQKRYENLTCVVNSHLNKILDIVPVTKCSSVILRDFAATLKKNIEALKKLNVDWQDLFEYLIIYLSEKKLDYGTKRTFEQERSLEELPKLEDFYTFLEKRCIILENLSSSETRSQNKTAKVSLHTQKHDNFSNKNRFSKNSQYDGSRYMNQNRESNERDKKQCTFNCIFCNTAGHKIYSCCQFTMLPHFEKEKFVKSNKLCMNCLGYKHFVKDCKSSQRCAICKQKHHSSLHVKKDQNRVQNNTESTLHSQNRTSHSSNSNFGLAQNNHNVEHNFHGSEDNNVRQVTGTQSPVHSFVPDAHSGVSTKSTQILLATARVKILSGQGLPVDARILLDNGSQMSFITQNLVRKIEGKPYQRKLDISGISVNNISSESLVDVSFYSRFDTKNRYSISCAVLDKITCKLPQTPVAVNELNIPRFVTPRLADPEFFVTSDIDILVGAEIFYNIICPEVYRLGENLPTLLNTHLGWIIAGNLPSLSDTCVNSFCVDNSGAQGVCLFSGATELDELLERFWSVEEIDDPMVRKAVLSPEEEMAEAIFAERTQILSNGQYQVDMPFKSPKEYLKLGNSFTIAENRFRSLEQRFKKDPKLFSDYKAFIDEYISLGHARVVPLSLRNKNDELKYFIPHLCVIRESSVTTKLRVVFDASCKTSTGISLNDVTLKGFQVQPELYDTVVRFRQDKYVLTCDIEKMYRRVMINPEHAFLQNILWRENPNDEFTCIELLTVTYGTNYAPFVATRVVKDAAISEQRNCPLGAETLLNRIFMDDVLGGVDHLEDLSKLYSELNLILNKAGFSLHKWCSNSQSFLKIISQQPKLEYDLNLDETPSKVLGMKWQPKKDSLIISPPQICFDSFPTKRTMLSVLAQCFDPLGLVNPVIVKGKILMQKLWLYKLGWDTVIDDEILLQGWKDFLEHISLLNSLEIPRYLLLDNNFRKLEIHGFADASMAAYGACVYIRSCYSDDLVHTALISSKSKVAPIRTVSLPRLELCAMLLLAKLCRRIVTIFEKKFSFNSINLWSDSQIALCWCQSHASRWSVFVSNRVAQIQELTSHYKWRHVVSSQNPADILSRGQFSREIIISGVWFNGPEFLRNPHTNFDEYNVPLEIVEVPEERKIICTVCNIPSECVVWAEIFTKFSVFSRLQRTVAYIFRFVNNLNRKKEKLSGPLSVNELSLSLIFIVKTLQNLYFSKEIYELKNQKALSNKNLVSLNLWLDTDGLIRVGGRLSNADIPFDQKYPMLLPARNPVVRLMLEHEHRRLGHGGAQTVLSSFRQRFWPLNGLRETKRAVRDCIRCFRFRALPSHQIMANLPKDRVLSSRPFQKVGIDFGGPFEIKSSRLRKAPVMKGYLALFVCMATKAVHLELITSLSTEAFLMTLKRFISRRGNPTVIYSDNATNFVGAKNQLRCLYDFFRNSETSPIIKEFLSQNETEWKFIPPRAPHWGGIWEAAIKSAKYHLNRLVGGYQLTYEELSTVLCQIEAIMNSRPLCPLSNDPLDFHCLTPGHFLIGSSLTAFPDKNLIDVPENRLNFWKKCSQLQQKFWKKWSVDYLNRLQNRPKWLYPAKNLKVNDLVLLREDNVPALSWPRARIVEVHEGSDGKVRVVKLRTPDGVVTRSIAKVSPLPTNE